MASQEPKRTYSVESPGELETRNGGGVQGKDKELVSRRGAVGARRGRSWGRLPFFEDPGTKVRVMNVN